MTRPVRTENHVQQRSFEHVGYRGRAPGNRLLEYRFGVEQLPGHSRVLAALTRKQPRCLRWVAAFTPYQSWCRPIVHKRIE